MVLRVLVLNVHQGVSMNRYNELIKLAIELANRSKKLMVEDRIQHAKDAHDPVVRDDYNPVINLK